MVPGNVWILVGESGGRARGYSAIHVPITCPMPTWEGTRVAPGKVLLVLLRLDLGHIFSFGVAGPIRKRIILGPPALAVRAGSLESVEPGL
jgi:hypothetical protein